MGFQKHKDSLYFTLGPLSHKALETGFQWQGEDQGFDFFWRFRTRGDHAGLSFHISIGRFLFEFNIHDTRHWNWKENRWLKPGEIEDIEEDDE